MRATESGNDLKQICFYLIKALIKVISALAILFSIIKEYIFFQGGSLGKLFRNSRTSAIGYFIYIIHRAHYKFSIASAVNLIKCVMREPGENSWTAVCLKS